jgi:hypothetical protein
LAERLNNVYEPNLRRLAMVVVNAIYDLRQRLGYDTQQLQYAVFGLRDLLKDGPVTGDSVRAWKDKAGISVGLLHLAAKLVGVAISRPAAPHEPGGAWARRKAGKANPPGVTPSGLSRHNLWTLLDTLRDQDVPSL